MQKTSAKRLRLLTQAAVLMALVAVGVLSLEGETVSAGSPAPANDDFADAIVISEPLPYSDKQDTQGATTETDEPLSCVSGSTVWYSFTPSVDSVLLGHAFIDGGSARLSVYSGPTLSSLAPEADCFFGWGNPEDQPPPSAFVAEAGTKYFFQAGGSGSDNLTFTLDGSPCQAAGCPEMLLNVPGVDCDDPDRPTFCSISVGEKFVLTVEIPAAPPQDYVLAQSYIEFGSALQYKPDPKDGPAFATNEIEWPDCDSETALRDQLTATSVLHGCISGIPIPELSDYTGTFIALSFTCSEAPSSTEVVLLPEGEPAVGSTSGALFVLPNGSTLRPERRTLTIDCVDVAPAAVGGLVLDSGLRGIARQDGGAPWLWTALGLGVIVAMSALAVARRRFAPR